MYPSTGWSQPRFRTLPLALGNFMLFLLVHSSILLQFLWVAPMSSSVSFAPPRKQCWKWLLTCLKKARFLIFRAEGAVYLCRQVLSYETNKRQPLFLLVHFFVKFESRDCYKPNEQNLGPNSIPPQMACWMWGRYFSWIPGVASSDTEHIFQVCKYALESFTQRLTCLCLPVDIRAEIWRTSWCICRRSTSLWIRASASQERLVAVGALLKQPSLFLQWDIYTATKRSLMHYLVYCVYHLLLSAYIYQNCQAFISATCFCANYLTVNSYNPTT